jgi:hypothetical protein
MTQRNSLPDVRFGSLADIAAIAKWPINGPLPADFPSPFSLS